VKYVLPVEYKNAVMRDLKSTVIFRKGQVAAGDIVLKAEHTRINVLKVPGIEVILERIIFIYDPGREGSILDPIFS